MTDIIIRNPNGLTSEQCIELVRRVIKKGQISWSRHGPCYCLFTTWAWGGESVTATRTATAHVFRVHKEYEKQLTP